MVCWCNNVVVFLPRSFICEGLQSDRNTYAFGAKYNMLESSQIYVWKVLHQMVHPCCVPASKVGVPFHNPWRRKPHHLGRSLKQHLVSLGGQPLASCLPSGCLFPPLASTSLHICPQTVERCEHVWTNYIPPYLCQPSQKPQTNPQFWVTPSKGLASVAKHGIMGHPNCCI